MNMTPVRQEQPTIHESAEKGFEELQKYFAVFFNRQDVLEAFILQRPQFPVCANRQRVSIECVLTEARHESKFIYPWMKWLSNPNCCKFYQSNAMMLGPFELESVTFTISSIYPVELVAFGDTQTIITFDATYKKEMKGIVQ